MATAKKTTKRSMLSRLAADPHARLVAPVTARVRINGRLETVRLSEQDCTALLHAAVCAERVDRKRH